MPGAALSRSPTRLPTAEIFTATELSTLGNFLYLSEWNLFLLLTWLGFSGAGVASVDQLIAGSDSSD